jgi:hypothetical protein
MSRAQRAHNGRRKTGTDTCRGGKRPNFRNEGFGYQIRASADIWGVAIEPFFLFTGPTATKPLPYAVQIEYSKHWNAKTGMNHLTFWLDFLTRGEPLVDLRDEHVHNLFLGRPRPQTESHKIKSHDQPPALG